MRFLKFVLPWSWTIAACMTGVCAAQEAGPITLQQLADQVVQLQRQVADLTKRLKAAEEPGIQTQASPPAGQNTAAVAPPAESSPQPALEETQAQPAFAFHAYGDVGYSYTGEPLAPRSFGVGDLDLFAKAQIAPKTSVLVEAVVDGDSRNDAVEVPIGLERLLVQYRAADFLRIEAGANHTAIGFYSKAYLRNSWLQTAATRPRMYTFEEDGGFLPLHYVGFTAYGQIPSGKLNLQYTLETGNSRNYGQVDRPMLSLSHHRAINIGLSAQPEIIPGLHVGFSSYRDRVSPVEPLQLRRTIWTGYAVYQRGRIEWLNEGLLLLIGDRNLGESQAPGFYTQMACRLTSSFKPYFRFEQIRPHGDGEMSAVQEFINWRRVFTTGVRYDFNESAAIKLQWEGSRDQHQRFGNGAALQLAFTF